MNPFNSKEKQKIRSNFENIKKLVYPFHLELWHDSILQVVVVCQGFPCFSNASYAAVRFVGVVVVVDVGRLYKSLQ